MLRSPSDKAAPVVFDTFTRIDADMSEWKPDAEGTVHMSSGPDETR